jgi:hypothetical protein
VPAETAPRTSDEPTKLQLVGTSYGALCAATSVEGFALDWKSLARIEENLSMPPGSRKVLIQAGALLLPFTFYQKAGAGTYALAHEFRPGGGTSRIVLVPTERLDKEPAFREHLSFGPTPGCTPAEKSRLQRLVRQAARNMGVPAVAEGVYFPDYAMVDGSVALFEGPPDGGIRGGGVFLPKGRYVFVLAGNGVSRLTLSHPDWNMCGRQLDPKLHETRIITRVHAASGENESVQAFAVTAMGCFAVGIFPAPAVPARRPPGD